jgi:hypothetical protein
MMNVRIMAAVVAISLVALLLTSCKDSATEPVNHPPIIESLTATPEIVHTNGITRLECQGSDQDGDSLSYWWLSSAGSFSGSQALPQIFWRAPNEHGIYTIRIRVSDGLSTVYDSMEVAAIDD